MTWKQINIDNDGKKIIGWQKENNVNCPNKLGKEIKTIVIDNKKFTVLSSKVDERDDIIFLTIDLSIDKPTKEVAPDGKSDKRSN
mgnify:CR=1 FL=1